MRCEKPRSEYNRLKTVSTNGTWNLYSFQKQLKGLLLIVLLAISLAACETDQTNGPRLVAQNTLDANATELPTLVQLPATALPTAVVTSELMSPVEVVTIPADFVIVTPTLPPSKTPTQTNTQTTTPTISPTPTITVTSSVTAPTFPTAVFSPTPAVVSNPVTELCMSQWEYIQPPPQGCPIYPATVGQGVYQEFERGYMFWVAPKEIYVLYNDGGLPLWTRFDDTFVEGTGQFPNSPWKDPYYDSIAPAGRWQPVRGFGKLWRNEDQHPQKALVQNRIGWGTMEFEKPYSIIKQVRTDGTIFLRDPDGRWFQLTPAGPWQLYAGNSIPPGTGGGGVNIPLP